MIGSALAFLKKVLDEHLLGELDEGAEPMAAQVVFVEGDKLETLVFKAEAVTLLLINVEEERVLRQPDLHARRVVDAQGVSSVVRGQPDLRLVLHLLFVARFKAYDTAWDRLTQIIAFLQSTPVFDAASWPTLPPGIEKLVLELTPLKLEEQSEVWSALRATQHPSVFYRAKLLVLHDAKSTTAEQVTLPVVVKVAQSPEPGRA
ncbi:MAG TPA: DUF4255 domain-containing protein [Polyangiaceae bacterium]|nr:DUF4255 domain-containing protein [Polyangiaceae bacterium]